MLVARMRTTATVGSTAGGLIGLRPIRELFLKRGQIGGNGSCKSAIILSRTKLNISVLSSSAQICHAPPGQMVIEVHPPDSFHESFARGKFDTDGFMGKWHVVYSTLPMWKIRFSCALLEHTIYALDILVRTRGTSP